MPLLGLRGFGVALAVPLGPLGPRGFGVALAGPLGPLVLRGSGLVLAGPLGLPGLRGFGVVLAGPLGLPDWREAVGPGVAGHEAVVQVGWPRRLVPAVQVVVAPRVGVPPTAVQE